MPVSQGSIPIVGLNVIAQNIVDFKLLVLWSMDVFFLATKGLMLLGTLQMRIKAGDLPQRKCPIH
jgi:hypothetical protein